MAKRENGTTRANRGTTTTNAADAAKATKTPAAVAARGGNKERSGGTVDAPGKRHRKPTRNDASASVVHSQADKLRTAKTMKKTNRLRGRG